MKRITLFLSVILVSTFSFKTMATPISLYCEPDINNHANKDHVFISFDIESQQVFNLLGYDSKSNYDKGKGLTTSP